MQAHAVPAYGALGNHAFAAVNSAGAAGQGNAAANRFAGQSATFGNDSFVPSAAGKEHYNTYDRGGGGNKFGIIGTLACCASAPLLLLKAKVMALCCGTSCLVGAGASTKALGCW